MLKMSLRVSMEDNRSPSGICLLSLPHKDKKRGSPSFMKNVLVIADNPTIARDITGPLQQKHAVTQAADGTRGLEIFSRRRFDLVFIDVEQLGILGNGCDQGQSRYHRGLQCFWEVFPGVQIIVTAIPEAMREVVEAVKSGAANYLTFPINPDELHYIVENLRDNLRVQSELNFLRDQYWERDSFEVLTTESPVMKRTLKKIHSVAPTRSTVLLLGETGTGKGVMAKTLHRYSNRQDRQFISVHCGAISDTLLESELFGHEKGAFTGAIRRKMGKFEIAHQGTIFLDEIGSISPSMQIKLLKVLQERTFERVGGEQSVTVDVRIIAATNSNLQKMSEEGTFRRDLFYRLNVFPIEVPSLRERIEDVELLVEAFLKGLNRQYDKKIHGIHPAVIGALSGYHWPGNIRELENLIERAYILETANILTPESFPGEFFQTGRIIPKSFIDTNLPLEEVRRQGVENLERQYLKKVLAQNNGKINATANQAGVGVRQLHKLLTKYGIHKEEFKTSHHSSGSDIGTVDSE